MNFSYKALKADGEPYEGEMEADDKFALFQLIKKEGGKIVSYQEAKKGSFHFALPSFLQRVKMHEKITVARSLGGMIEAGLALSRLCRCLSARVAAKNLRKCWVHW